MAPVQVRRDADSRKIRRGIFDRRVQREEMVRGEFVDPLDRDRLVPPSLDVGPGYEWLYPHTNVCWGRSRWSCCLNCDISTSKWLPPGVVGESTPGIGSASTY